MESLSNTSVPGERPPIRMVHLGLGAFHRAHQAWYTHRANQLTAAPGTGSDGGQWGIAAFTGRSPRAAEVLAKQDGLYTLLVRDKVGDTAQIIASIIEAVNGGDGPRWRQLVSAPETAVITLTVTEAGYHHHATMGLDYGNAEIDEDIHFLRSSSAMGAARTAPGRLVDGLRARRNAGSGALAVVSCDNLSHNGEVTRTVVLQLAMAVETDLAGWIDANVSFVSTMVDRITPASIGADLLSASDLTGLRDQAPVVTEPYSAWVIAGDFPAGRPDWELSGARFVDNIASFEERKLWLLNAGHSLLAYSGLLRGHETIADTMKDAECVDLLEQLWSDARAVLPFPEVEIDTALQDLRTRFHNPRIRHQLTQIAAEGSIKLRMRAIPVIRKRLAMGLDAGSGEVGLIAAWLRCLGRPGITFHDPGAVTLVPETEDQSGFSPSDATAALAHLAPDLAGSAELAAAVVREVQRLAATSTSTPV